MAMRNQFGWDAGRGGFHLDTAALTDGPAAVQTFIEFVVPGHREEERPAAPESVRRGLSEAGGK
jgi:hypothetical protein